MISKITSFIQQNKLLSQGDSVVAGVSGGADSICLLHVLIRLREEYHLSLHVVHINHGLRAEEAGRDEQFVETLCKSLQLSYACFHYDVGRIAREEGLSEEEAGRKVRYQAFLEYSRTHQCNKLAVAHNKNDNAETFLFHLFRGSGITGLSGMEAGRLLQESDPQVTLIRPLLCVSREEIEDFLAREGISYIIDSSNLADKYSRNKIRNHILNYASAEINVQSVGNIIEAANTLKEIGDYLNKDLRQRYLSMVKEEEGSFSIAAQDLAKEHIVIQKGLVRLLLERLAGQSKDLEAKHVEAALLLLTKQVGKQVHLPYGIIAEREYNDIKFYRIGEQEVSFIDFAPVKILIPGRTELPKHRLAVLTELMEHKKIESIPKSHYTKWFDYDKIENAVQIRTRKEGDFIQINAMGGRKKLKDYFIDQKIPRKVRDNLLLITDGSHVMWIPDSRNRMSERYKINGGTKTILSMSLIDMEEMKNER